MSSEEILSIATPHGLWEKIFGINTEAETYLLNQLLPDLNAIAAGEIVGPVSLTTPHGTAHRSGSAFGVAHRVFTHSEFHEPVVLTPYIADSQEPLTDTARPGSVRLASISTTIYENRTSSYGGNTPSGSEFGDTDMVSAQIALDLKHNEVYIHSGNESSSVDNYLNSQLGLFTLLNELQGYPINPALKEK
jgi:hypothetical protein